MRQILESAESVAPHAAEPAPVPDRSGYRLLYERSYDELLQQTYLLTGGRRRLAEHAVQGAFDSAWNRWAEAATDPDPARWLRTRAFAAALAPWHPDGPPHTRRPRLPWRPPAAPPPGPDTMTAEQRADQALLDALRRLSRARRHVLLLHDALGLAPAEIALEVEASNTAVVHRLHAARFELARALPTPLGADPLTPGFGGRLGGLLYETAVRHCPPAAAGRQVPRALPARARLRAAALPVAAGLLVLGTAAAITGTLNGHGPSEFFNRPPTPAPLCTSSLNGSAGPASPERLPGIRSLWCTEGGPHVKHRTPDR